MPCREPISEAGYALSLKQPWAALLVYGYKCIEVRTWPTARRGPVLIHAARVPDPRPEVWSLVPAELDQAARLVGGILGAGDLIDCRTYRTADAFAADRARHLNDPRWFRQPALYGFVFADLTALPFRVYRGGMRFFPVAQHSIDPGTGPGDLFTNP
ncbi:MAG TPA: hypothetical protein VG013_14000 [Gemmataceae bacterium]|nr:hypothetical protein [Gemmataceae bacterium]